MENAAHKRSTLSEAVSHTNYSEDDISFILDTLKNNFNQWVTHGTAYVVAEHMVPRLERSVESIVTVIHRLLRAYSSYVGKPTELIKWKWFPIIHSFLEGQPDPEVFISLDQADVSETFDRDGKPSSHQGNLQTQIVMHPPTTTLSSPTTLPDVVYTRAQTQTSSVDTTLDQRDREQIQAFLYLWRRGYPSDARFSKVERYLNRNEAKSFLERYLDQYNRCKKGEKPQWKWFDLINTQLLKLQREGLIAWDGLLQYSRNQNLSGTPIGRFQTVAPRSESETVQTFHQPVPRKEQHHAFVLQSPVIPPDEPMDIAPRHASSGARIHLDIPSKYNNGTLNIGRSDNQSVSSRRVGLNPIRPSELLSLTPKDIHSKGKDFVLTWVEAAITQLKTEQMVCQEEYSQTSKFIQRQEKYLAQMLASRNDL